MIWTEVSTVATAAFTAIAAGAAWATVTTEIRRQRRAAQPRLLGTFIAISGEGIIPQDQVEILNVGGGHALAVGLFGFDGTETYSVAVAPAIAPAERVTIGITIGRNRHQTSEHAQFIVSARATDGRLFVWSGDHRTLVDRPKRGGWPVTADLFRRLYPDVELPPTA